MLAGQVAVNYADKKIFGKHPGSGAVVQVAASPIHSHEISDVNGLQDALDNAGGGGGISVASDSYTEPTFTNGILTALTTWSDSTKAVLVQTKTFAYTNGNLTQVTVTDGAGATTMTKTINYAGDDNFASITDDYA
jgi:hypothetical protein